METELLSIGISPAYAVFMKKEHEEKLKFFSSPEYQKAAQAMRDFMENLSRICS